MIFKNVKKIILPEGEVETIVDSESKIIWQRPHLYGVSWTSKVSPTMTRTDDSQNFASPIIGSGTTKGSSPFDKCYPWKDIRVVEISGNTLVEIPKFWFKWEKSGSTITLKISDVSRDGFFVSPMHADRADGKGERDYAYIGKYKSVYDYASKAGYNPLRGKTIVAARNGSKSLGSGFFQYDIAAFWTIRMLFYVEFATWDGKGILTNTQNFSSLDTMKTGGTASMAYHTGISGDGYSSQYRYVEDLWENGLEWVDGIYFSGTSVYVIKNPNNFATGSNGIKIGTRPTSNGFISSWTIPSLSGYEYSLIPSSITSTIGYTKDGYYYGSSGTTLYTGGARTDMEVHGTNMYYTDFSASGTSTSITSRIMYLP